MYGVDMFIREESYVYGRVLRFLRLQLDIGLSLAVCHTEMFGKSITYRRVHQIFSLKNAMESLLGLIRSIILEVLICISFFVRGCARPVSRD